MNINLQERVKAEMEESPSQKRQPADFSLTYQQYLVIQHALPKKYTLIPLSNIKKKGELFSSAAKSAKQEKLSDARIFGSVDNAQSLEGRNKRIKFTKVDRFLEQKPQRSRKLAIMSQLAMKDQMAECKAILNSLKKHKNARPFLNPVDTIKEGVPNYYQIIQQPMDLSTVQAKLEDGVYQSPQFFHMDIKKIWMNSYHFNCVGSHVHQCTVIMERYYKSLVNNYIYKKSMKAEKLKAKASKDRTKKETTEQRSQQNKNALAGFLGTDVKFGQEH